MSPRAKSEEPPAEETTVDRLTMISTAGWMSFEPAVFVHRGEAWWVSARSLCFRKIDGEVREYEARPRRPETDPR